MHSTGWFFGTDAAWSFRSIWYGRPCHSAALLQDNLWHHWHCASLDNFLPPWEKAVCQLQRIQINSVIVTVWSCTRIGSWTDPVPSVQIYSRLIDGTEQHSHGSVDNTQIYGSCAAPALQQRILTCVVSMLEWMQSNRLQLNATKTKQLWCALPRQQEYLPNTSPHWLWHGTAGEVRAESGDIHRERPIHEKSCLKGCLKLLRRPLPTLKYP